MFVSWGVNGEPFAAAVMTGSEMQEILQYNLLLGKPLVAWTLHCSQGGWSWHFWRDGFLFSIFPTLCGLPVASLNAPTPCLLGEFECGKVLHSPYGSFSSSSWVSRERRVWVILLCFLPKLLLSIWLQIYTCSWPFTSKPDNRILPQWPYNLKAKWWPSCP